jgi:hypothetical protein
MRRRGLILTTLGAVLLTGFVYLRSAWPSGSEHQDTIRVVPADSSGDLNSEAGWRYRQCQPRHWRYCMIQH